MRATVLLVLLCLFAVGFAYATIPDPGHCSVDPLDTRGRMTVTPHYRGAITDPPTGAQFTVNVRNASDLPIPDAFVEIIFDDPNSHVECSNIAAIATTDNDGNVTFNIAAGGCNLAEAAVRIIANTVPIASFKVTSPDADASGSVSLADFTAFGADYFSGVSGCFDFDGNGTTLGDFTLFGQCYNLACDPF